MTKQPLAYLYPEFLESQEGRPIRILAEYLEPLRRFKEQKIQDTVVFFGSARVDSREHADARGDAGAWRAQRTPNQAELNEQTRRSVGPILREARESCIADGVEPDAPLENRFVVTSGGGPGIWKPPTAAPAKPEAKTVGLNIRLPLGGSQSSHQLHFRVPLLLHAEFWFAYSQGARDFSRQLRHVR